MGEKYEYLKKVLDAIIPWHCVVPAFSQRRDAGLSKTRITLMRLSRSTEDHRKIFSQVPIT